MDSETKGNIKAWSSCLLFKGCDWYSSHQKEKKHEAYIEKKRNDSIRKAFIKDSLAHDPHYQDSLRREKVRYEKWEKEEKLIKQSEIAGFSIEGDSVYHTALHVVGFIEDHSLGFTLLDRPKLRFYTMNEVRARSLSLCDVCEEIDNVFNKYLNHEIINIEDARDYDLIPVEDASIYCDRIHDSEPLDDADRY